MFVVQCVGNLCVCPVLCCCCSYLDVFTENFLGVSVCVYEPNHEGQVGELLLIHTSLDKQARHTVHLNQHQQQHHTAAAAPAAGHKRTHSCGGTG